MPGGGAAGFLSVRRGVGLKRVHGPEQRAADELGRALGPDVDAEIQQRGGIASGCFGHAQQIAAVGMGFDRCFVRVCGLPCLSVCSGFFVYHNNLLRRC